MSWMQIKGTVKTTEEKIIEDLKRKLKSLEVENDKLKKANQEMLTRVSLIEYQGDIYT